MWRTSHAFSTSTCCCGSGLISSAKALRVNMLLAHGCCVYLVNRKRSILFDNHQLGLVREKRSLAGLTEANLNFALRSITDHERDAARAVLVVANDRSFHIMRRARCRTTVLRPRRSFLAQRGNAGLGPTLLRGRAAAAPRFDGADPARGA